MRTLKVDGSVVALAAAAASDGRILHVAFVMRANSCDSVLVWQLARRRLERLSPRWCDRRVYGLSLSESAASWATYRQLDDGTQVQEVWRVKVTPSREYGPARRLARAEAEAGQKLPFVVGNDSMVYDGRVYAGGRLMPSSTIPTLSSAPRWVSFEEFTVLVGYPNGRVETYLTQRAPNDPVPYATAVFKPPKAMRVVRVVSVYGVAVMVGPHLALRNNTLRSGPETELPRAASYGDDRCFHPRCPSADLRFADQSGPFTVYLLGRQIHVRQILTGKDAIVRIPSATPVHAQMRPTGLVYSAGDTITYLPRADVTRLIG